MNDDPQTIVPYDRIQAVQSDKGQMAIANPNSAVIWKYDGHDRNSDGKLEFHEQMHRTVAPVVITGDLLFVSDFSGLLHCLDQKTGRPYWTYEVLAAIWSAPFVADGKVYVTDEDGVLAVLRISADPRIAGTHDPDSADHPTQIEPVRRIDMGQSCYTTPTASPGVLFVASKTHLFAIEAKPTVP